MIHQEPFISKPNETDRDWERYLHREGIPAFSLHAGPSIQRDAPGPTLGVFHTLYETLRAHMSNLWHGPFASRQRAR